VLIVAITPKSRNRQCEQALAKVRDATGRTWGTVVECQTLANSTIPVETQIRNCREDSQPITVFGCRHCCGARQLTKSGIGAAPG
jgi:hypothetical protein